MAHAPLTAMDLCNDSAYIPLSLATSVPGVPSSSHRMIRVRIFTYSFDILHFQLLITMTYPKTEL